MNSTASLSARLTLGQLTELANQPTRILPELYRVLLTTGDPSEETRAWACDCLQQVPAIDEAKAAEIVPLCEHENEFVVYWTVTMLGKLVNANAYQRLLCNLLRTHDSISVRQAAAKSLKKVTPACSESIAALTEAAQSSDPRLQRLAEQTLAALQ